MPVTSAQVVIGTEKNPDSAILLNYDEDDYSQGYGQIKEVFRALTKDDILQPYTSEHDFTSKNNGDNFGNNIQSVDIRHQIFFENAQPIKKEFEISENIPAGIYGNAFVLTNKITSISSDGQRMFDLV